MCRAVNQTPLRVMAWYGVFFGESQKSASIVSHELGTELKVLIKVLNDIGPMRSYS